MINAPWDRSGRINQLCQYRFFPSPILKHTSTSIVATVFCGWSYIIHDKRTLWTLNLPLPTSNGLKRRFNSRNHFYNSLHLHCASQYRDMNPTELIPYSILSSHAASMFNTDNVIVVTRITPTTGPCQRSQNYTITIKKIFFPAWNITNLVFPVRSMIIIR